MKPIWQIDSQDVMGLQGRDVDFAQFVNDLLAQHAAAGQLASAALRLNLKTQAPDGGVDGAVSLGIAAAFDPEGYFDTPTCWQYKTSPTGNIKPTKKKKGGQQVALREELGKPEAARFIASGYAYRFCIADDLPPPAKVQWEAWLSDEARKIDANARPARVLTADDLARWANRLPGAILPFRPYLGAFQSLRLWGSEITSQTPHFVPIAAWQAGMEILRDHADLGKACLRVVRTVQGEAGVGKTRCVYEALASSAENRARVVYTTNEVEAERIADILANDSRFSGIIVADECSVESRVRLERRLQAHTGRLRVIAIDNQLQDEPTGTGEVRLQRIAEAEVEQILDQHFPGLPPQQLRAFVALSKGFVRLALELCAHADLIPANGQVGPVLTFFREHYLRSRLPRDDEQQAVDAVALLPRVGYKDDVRFQLEGLCEAVGLHPERVVETAVRLKQAPGFIALGERYLYVTPQLIAQAAFQSAWARWIKADPERFFLVRFPGSLIDHFTEQLRACGTEEMKRVFFGFFQTWASRLRGPDLADEVTVRRLVRLVEVEPKMLLPQLRRLLESTPVEQLLQLHARDSGAAEDVQELKRSASGQAARRELVWVAEKFLHFREHFADAERILLRLALAETEAYANNASGVWREVFRPLLSGTPVPFAERIRLLEHRFQTEDARQRSLCLGALHGPLTADGLLAGRLLGPPVVAGRIPPSDWQPADGREMLQCWRLTVDLLKRLAGFGSAALRDDILGVLSSNLTGLLRNGFLSDVVEIVGQAPLPEPRLAELLRELDWFFQVYCSPDSRQVPVELETALRDWRRRLVPDSLHGRLVAVVGQEPWHLSGQAEDHAASTFAALARDLLNDPSALERELPWLCSREARSAELLGFALGSLTAGATQLDRVLRTAAARKDTGIAHGYLRGVAQAHPEQIARANELLDQLQPTYPRPIFSMTSGGPAAFRPLQRLLAMVDAGQLSVEFLRSVTYGLGNESLAPVELRQVLDRLVSAGCQGNEAAARAAIHVLWRELRPHGRPARPDLQPDAALKTLLETVLHLPLRAATQEAHAWADLLDEFARVDPTEAIRLAIQAAAAGDPPFARRAVDYLGVAAHRDPEAVMRLLGEGLLDPATGWRLGLHPLRDLIALLPAGIVRRWLDTHGRRAAVVLARHLPVPHLNDAGNAVVPALTAYVLEHFVDDDRVFREFCAGTHSGQMTFGDITVEHEREAEVARRFLDHPLERVRDWAQHEINRAVGDAVWWRVRDEEMTAP